MGFDVFMVIAVVGGGKMGISHAALVTPYVGKQNVVVCDPSFSARAFFKFLGYRTFRTVDHALAAVKELSGIIIATPTSTHAALVSWAILNNIPFFVEKPFTLDADLGETLANQAYGKNIYGQVGFVMRYADSFCKLYEIVGSNILGETLEYSAFMHGNAHSAPIQEGKWQGDLDAGGGCLNEYGPHLLDLIVAIFGPYAGVGSIEATSIFSPNADDKIGFEIEHESGLKGLCSLSWCDPSKRKSVLEFVVKFESAELRVDQSTVEIVGANSLSDEMLAKLQLVLGKRRSHVGFYLRGEEFSLEIEDFLRSAKVDCVHISSDPSYRSAIPTPTTRDGVIVDRAIATIISQARFK